MTDHLLKPMPAVADHPAGDPAYGRIGTPHALDSDDGTAQALVSAALLTVVVVVAVGLRVAQWHGWVPQGRPLGELVSLSPLALLAVVVAARGRTIARRLLGAGLVVTAIGLSLAYNHLVLPRLFEALARDSGPTVLRVVMSAESAMVTMLLVAGWSVARRRHPAWLLGAVVGGTLAAAASWFQILRFLPWADSGDQTLVVVASALVFHTVAIVGGLVGWLTDRVLTTGSTAPMQQ